MPKKYKVSKISLSAQSEAFLEMLTKRGLVGDRHINDETIKQAEKEKKRRLFHNTQLLLRQNVLRETPEH